ncbi:MAG TPA: ATP-binding protein, partial [Actinomycetales bacterium]|nr:ATP-binding protein [Actinomycetales bacterium]
VRLSVVDDGPGPGAHPGHGYGLAGMRERARLLGGELATGAAPGRGFGVQVTLPLAGAASP